MPDIQNLSPKAVKPLTLLNKTNEVIDALNENLNSSYAEQNPVLTSVEGICTWTVIHNLGTEDVSCTVYEGDKEIITDKEITSENVVTISINSSSNIPAETYSTLILVKGGIGSSGEGGGSSDITVDSSLSTSSTNPVQNRIITNALNGKIKGLRESVYSDRLSLVGGLTPNANNIVTIPEGNFSKYVDIHIGVITQDNIGLTWRQRWTTEDNLLKHVLCCTDKKYFPAMVANYLNHPFVFWYPNQQNSTGNTFLQTEWATFTISLNKQTGTSHFNIVGDSGVVYMDEDGPINTNTSSSVDVTVSLCSSYNREGIPYVGTEVEIDLSSIILTKGETEYRMVENDPYINIDSLVIPQSLISNGFANLIEATSNRLGLVKVDSALSSTSENPIQNKVLYPSLNGFIPAGTVIKVETDGSGDFTSITDAVNSLNGKWSNGTVTIQIGNGTFNVPSTIVLHGDNFNFPRLTIKGNGTNNTTILANDIAEYTATFEVRRCFVVFTDFELKRTTSTASRYGIVVHSFGRTTVSGVIVDNLPFSLRALDGGELEIGQVTIKNCQNAIDCVGGYVHSYNATININTATYGFRVATGGVVKDTNSTITYTNVTNKTNQTVGTATNDGWITGITL